MEQLIMLVVIFLPLYLLLVTANLAERSREQEEPNEGWRIITYVFATVLFGSLLLIGLGIQLIAAIMASGGAAFGEFENAMRQGMPMLPIESLSLVAVGVWLPSLFALILLLPFMRRLIARFIPIDPESPVHAIALSFIMLVVINLIVTLGVGLSNLAESIADQGTSGAASIPALWVQQLLTALMALIGVGWIVRHNWGGSLERLGIRRPTGRQILIGIGIGLLMVPAVMLLEAGASLIGITADPDVENLTEQLLGPLFNTPLGIITLGVAAALGEETLFRGAVLPRFGVILTSFLFALVHSNYGITFSTLVVFLLGFVLAILRRRYNTTTAMFTHAVYNMSLGIIAYLSTLFLQS